MDADSALVDDPFELADAYGSDAAARLAAILELLERAGFAKARANEWSAFDRILSGVAWALQQLVPREASATGRVRWDALFTSHAKMRPRLGFAQDVVRCIDALPLAARRTVQIQPHQLLLQDFGDIGAVHRLVAWLLEQLTTPGTTPHLDAIRTERRYQSVLFDSGTTAPSPPLKQGVTYVQQTFRPQRKWQFTGSSDWQNEPEDALIQRCLLEYGERVCVAPEASTSAGSSSVVASVADSSKPPNLMAQLASQAAAAATAGPTAARGRPGSGSRRNASSKRFIDPQAAEFELQYQRAMQQAAAEQHAQLTMQKARERELLQQVVSVREVPDGLDKTPRRQASGASEPVPRLATARIEQARSELQEHERDVTTLIEAKQALDVESAAATQHAAAIAAAIVDMESAIAQLDRDEAQLQRSAHSDLTTLKRLVAQNEALKRAKSALRASSQDELTALEMRVAQLQAHVAADAAHADEEALRLREVEQLHAQMASKHKAMRVALATQTRAVQRVMRQIDDVPTRSELLQYETRFLELYDEVALTLDETRKYFATYNALQTTQAFVEKEIALLESIHANFDVAMASKTATRALFDQLDTIQASVASSVRQQQSVRDAHSLRVETLESKYQLLLEKERTYVNAIREFQRECEKNERLAAKLAHARSQ